MDEISDNRSLRAVAIDRAKKAKYRTSNYELWLRNKNTMDYTGYDHPRGEIDPIVRKPVPVVKKQPVPKAPSKDDSSEGDITPAQRAEAKVIFLAQPLQRQIKDVQKTQHVITKAKEFKQYRTNPYGNDIENLDTPDETARSERQSFLAEQSNIAVFKGSYKSATERGFFIENVRTKDALRVDKPYKNRNELLRYIVKGFDKTAKPQPSVFISTTPGKNTVEHEIGHGIEAQTFGLGGFKRKLTRETRGKTPNSLVNQFTYQSFRVRPVFSDRTNLNSKQEILGEFKELRAQSRQHYAYRMKGEEQFADFFAGAINDPGKTKKNAKYAYNVLKKQSFFKGYKKKNKDIASKQLKRLIGNF